MTYLQCHRQRKPLSLFTHYPIAITVAGTWNLRFRKASPRSVATLHTLLPSFHSFVA